MVDYSRVKKWHYDIKSRPPLQAVVLIFEKYDNGRNKSGFDGTHASESNGSKTPTRLRQCSGTARTVF